MYGLIVCCVSVDCTLLLLLAAFLHFHAAYTEPCFILVDLSLKNCHYQVHARMTPVVAMPGQMCRRWWQASFTVAHLCPSYHSICRQI